MMIRPLLQNVTILAALHACRCVTMRTYSEEKRSGTIELLLTSPLTDFQIIMGKFLGAMALCGVDARRHADPHRPILFIYGRPEWKPIVTAYLGLLLFGGCFISVGLFISSLTKNQIVAGDGDLRRVPVPAGSSPGSAASRGRPCDKLTSYLSIIDHFDDFGKASSTRRTSSTTLSFITFGLFLTAKSVDSERWRG